MALVGVAVSLTKLGNSAKRLALRLVLLLALVGQGYAVAHDHSHADFQPDATSCVICHSSSSMDDAVAGSSWSPIVDCRSQTFIPADPTWLGFAPCQTAKARAPPAT